ncbi:MAG: ABC transporter ATP-binding protein [Promethearchaeota archaeon]
MPLVNALVATVLLFFIAAILNNNIPEEGRISRRIHKFSSSVSSLIIFGIIFSIRLLFEAFGNFYIFEDYYIFRYLSTDAFLFAIMATIYLPVHAIFLKIFAKYKRDDDENTVQSAQFKGIYKKFIILAWIVGIIFLSIPLLQIPVGINNWMDLFNKSLDPDEFYLGFLWAIFSIGFAIIITYMVNQTRSIERRIPSVVLKKAMYTGGIISFGIWSIQLVIVELYIGRLFNFYLYQQDIRVLILVVNAVYIAVFYLTLKRIFQPQAVNQSELRLQEAFEIYEKRWGEKIRVVGNHVILEVQDLTTYFYTEEGVVKAVEGVSFKINEGETLGLVGETGCGKSVTALSILQVIRPPGKIEKGKVIFRGEDLLQRSKAGVLDYRGKEITMIFQDPLNSLNPVFKIGAQITEVYLLHMENELLVEASKQNKSTFAVAREWGEQLLRDLNIPFPEVIYDRYPHELSGGMRQRVQIAMGLACKPHLLIADEPTTALDVTIQNQILKLMKELKTKFNASMLFITHDLGIISKMCEKVAVMYSGFIVENGDIKKLFVRPYHPYTRGLIGSVPVVGKKRRRLEVIKGTVPNLIYPPSGCRFHPRCNYCFEPCDSKIPRSIEVEQDYLVACHLYDPQYKELAEISIKNVEENNL